MTDAELHATDPTAELLFGRPPGRLIRCPGCLTTAEPFKDGLCWCCVMSAEARAQAREDWITKRLREKGYDR